jgi:hypothetical protein
VLLMLVLVASVILYIMVEKPIDRIRQRRAPGGPQPGALQAVGVVRGSLCAKDTAPGVAH